MREPGYLTKAEAATLLVVDERTIERRARAGLITSKARPGFPTLYLLADVEKLRQAGRGEVRTGILEPIPTVPANGHGTQLVNSPLHTASADPIRQLAALVVQSLTHPPTGPTGPTVAPTGPTAAYVAKADALAIAGISDGELRKAVRLGEVRVRGRRYRRQDLEAL